VEIARLANGDIFASLTKELETVRLLEKRHGPLSLTYSMNLNSVRLLQFKTSMLDPQTFCAAALISVSSKQVAYIANGREEIVSGSKEPMDRQEYLSFYATRPKSEPFDGNQGVEWKLQRRETHQEAIERLNETTIKEKQVADAQSKQR
jgi:hypothetical protein